ncbi:MAG: DUF488 domain-containing protein [Vicinamibacteria bacterium]
MHQCLHRLEQEAARSADTHLLHLSFPGFRETQSRAALDRPRRGVVDVRRLPGSRSFPQYNSDALADSLSASGIDYWYLLELCGRRTVGELDGAPTESFWSNASFARYAAYARSDAFARGLDELLLRAARQRSALMCSEAVCGAATAASSPTP